MISLSEIMPNARNTITRGTGFLTFGIFTTMFPPEYLIEFNRVQQENGIHIFTDNVRIGLDTFSDTERMLAEA